MLFTKGRWDEKVTQTLMNSELPTSPHHHHHHYWPIDSLTAKLGPSFLIDQPEVNLHITPALKSAIITNRIIKQKREEEEEQ